MTLAMERAMNDGKMTGLPFLSVWVSAICAPWLVAWAFATLFIW